MKNSRKTPIGKYLLISLAIFIASVITSIVTRMSLVGDSIFSGFSEEQASLVVGMIEGAVGAISAGFVLYQLRIGDSLEERQNDIEESKFLLQYNQAFIQDPNMCLVEQCLEQWMENPESKGAIINEENRQLFINYLVYLEGLAPLVFRKILRLEHIDDLMAYRFFLAVNNPELQRDQLFRYPDYYRGCFKLYSTWKQYRHAHQLPILLNDYSLDKWSNYEKYVESPISVRQLLPRDDWKTVAGLLYDTDRFIYPAAFGTRKTAQRIITQWMELPTIFSSSNCVVAVKHDTIVGAALVVSNKPLVELPTSFRGMPTSYQDVRGRYFLPITDEKVKDNESIYIACVCVDKHNHRERIGEMLVKHIINNDKYIGCKIILDVCSDNQIAINLYEKYDFRITHTGPGYAYNSIPPKCHQMEYIAKKKA